MKKRIIVLSCLFFLFAFCNINGQNVDWNLTGAGARAAGMGGAFIGVADDATAIVWNPAGLTYLEKPEASLVTRLITDKYKWDDESDDETQSHFILNFLSGAVPLNLDNIKIIPALAFQRQIDFYSYDKTEDEDTDYYELDKYETTGGIDTATLGVGVQLLSYLFAGFSTNIWFGSYKCIYDYEYIESNYEHYYTEEYEETYSGINFVFGAMSDFNNLDNPIPFKFGVTFRTPFDLKADEEGSLIEIETGYEDYYCDWESSYTVEMPRMIGFGASYRYGENLTVSADYEMRKYSDLKISYEDLGKEEDEDEPYDLNQFRVGGEYILVTDLAIIPIRGGFQTVPTLFVDYYNDQVIGTGFSLGTGLIFERFALDVTFSYSSYEIEVNERTSVEFSKNTISLSGIFYF